MANLSDRFEEIYKTHYKVLRQAAEHIVGDKDAAHDVVQEVFVKLWHRKDDLGAILNEKAYLMRSVVNTSLTYISQNKKQKELTEYHLEADGKADSALMEKELQQKIQVALDHLPPKCKAVFVLSRFENLKNKEIAETMGLSLKTVENQMGIALKKLRDELKSYFKGDFMPFLFMALLPLLKDFMS